MVDQSVDGSGVPIRRAAAPSAMPAGLALAGKSVALVHEWFSALGGSENVFCTIAGLIPHGRRFVLWKEHNAHQLSELRESWLARTPLRKSKALALPLMPLAWRTLSRERFDVVLSSSHAFAHTVKLGEPGETRHLSYVHSPARYVWSPDFDGRGSSTALNVPRRVLQSVDRRLSRHVDSYAANSREVQKRIQRFWRRDAYVVNPPVDVAYFTDAPIAQRYQDREYLLGIGRWIKYKNFDFMIEIAEAAGLPLVIAGGGPEEEALRKAAQKVRVPVAFENRPSRERLRELYWGARALLFPAHEDFGIVPVEAQACGTPVIGFDRGGLLETVVHGETGYLIAGRSPRDYADAVKHVGELSPSRMTTNAERFSERMFAANLSLWISAEAG